NHSSSSSLLNASFGTITGWTHIALVYDEAYEFYLNGQKIDKTGNCPLFSGGAPHLGDYSYQGRLDEFRIYNHTLTPLEIQLLYAETNGEPILRTDIEHNASVGTAYSLSLNADNSPTTYFAEGLPPGLSLNVTTGAISGTPQSAGVYPVTIRASNEHGTSEDIIQLSVYPPSYQPPQGLSSIGEDDVPTNKLSLWLDANDVDADGQPDSNIGGSELLKWQDKSPRKLSAERGLPLYLSKSLNNMPSVAFNEMQRMDLGSNHIFSYGTSEENGLTIVAVANSTDPTSNTFQRKLIDFGHGPKKGWGVIFRKNGGNFYTPTDHNGIDLEYSMIKSPEDFTIGSFRVTFGQLQEVFIDGNLVAFDTIGLTSLTNLEINASQYRSSTSGPLRIGGTSQDNNKHLQVKSESLTGNIAELLVWKRALADSERVVVEQYLAQKWGLQHQTYLPPLEQPESGLIGRWTFDEGEGDLVHDVSGNRKHGTMTNMHPINSWVDGAYGKALEFDGVDDNFTIPNLGDEYRTIAFWLKTGPTTGASTIAKFGDQSAMLNVTNRPLVLCKVGTRGTNTPSSLDVTDVGWSHIAFRWNLGSTRYDILVNGQSQSVGTMWGPHASMIINESIILASSPTIKIDDLRIYSRSLTDAEIKNICGDLDEDGLTDIREAELGTDPNVADTDGDGDSDSAEISAGTSPTDPAENTMSKSLKSGLQVHLKFDETNGTIAYDSSGNNKHSTLYGFEANQTTFVEGKIGNAIKFDGTNDYVMLPNALGINFTFSFWINTSSNLGDSNSSNWDGQVGLITSSLNQHAMMLSQGKFRIWSGTSSACRMTSKNFVNNSSWIHLAASRTQAYSGGSQIGNFKMYLNGSLDSSSQKDNTRFSDGAILHIGKTHNGSNYFEGLMDNIHIYDRMLTDSEVLALYLLGL
ncbi:MAG TPA: hypothetical protein DCF87_09490, partial [Opitutae bacterium]|nr:hypothetical protein [Opitutae bacterium]